MFKYFKQKKFLEEKAKAELLAKELATQRESILQRNKELIINRIKEYLRNNPFVEDSLWSWSTSKRIDLIFPELLFKHKQTGRFHTSGVAFQFVDSNNPEEIEEVREILGNAGVPHILIDVSQVPSKEDLKLRIENSFDNKYSLTLSD